MGRIPGPLEGAHVVVTRPAHQAEVLCERLEAAGATVLRFPALAIEPVDDGTGIDQTLAALDRQQLLVFTSANAVTGLRKLLSRRDLPLPLDIPCAAVGRRTGEELRAAGMRHVTVAPAPYTSEALLAEPAMQQIAGKRAMLVTGEGGRGLLPKELQARGADITIMAVYRRVPPSGDPEPLRYWLDGRHAGAILATSAEALNNLMDLAGASRRAALLATDLVTVSSRIADAARERGFQGRITVTEPGDAALVQGVVRWWQQADERATDD